MEAQPGSPKLAKWGGAATLVTFLLRARPPPLSCHFGSPASGGAPKIKRPPSSLPLTSNRANAEAGAQRTFAFQKPSMWTLKLFQVCNLQRVTPHSFLRTQTGPRHVTLLPRTAARTFPR